MNKFAEIVKEAKRLAEQSVTWADLSNALFEPNSGLVFRTFPDRKERDAFRKTGTYRTLHDLVQEKMSQTGLVEGAEPQKSGRFVVRLPRSMHAALEREARDEGTSLNQLVLAKLAVQLSTATTARKGRRRAGFRGSARPVLGRSGRLRTTG
jgi:predicted HicB family RNase H-like nuclease